MSNAVTQQQTRQPGTEVAISGARLPYPKGVEERFGVDRAGWRALVDAVFPAAKTPDSIILALSYCKARKLDPFKRVVHIVPVWDSQQKRKIGRASCRERVCPYVSISVVAVPLKKKKEHTSHMHQTPEN